MIAISLTPEGLTVMKDGYFLQELLSSSPENSGMNKKESDVVIKDVNFDGYRDIGLRMDTGTGGDIFQGWLYHRETGRFEDAGILMKDLFSTMNSKVDAAKRQFTSVWYGGAAGNNRSETTYQISTDGYTAIPLSMFESEAVLDNNPSGYERCVFTSYKYAPGQGSAVKNYGAYKDWKLTSTETKKCW